MDEPIKMADPLRVHTQAFHHRQLIENAPYRIAIRTMTKVKSYQNE